MFYTRCYVALIIMITLQDLKDKLEELETSLPENQKLSDIPLQHNRNDDYDDIDIEVYNYLGFIYATVVIS
jgi:hypothetical protein